MSQQRLPAIGICAAALVALGMFASTAHARPTGVAVVDVQKTFDALKEKLQVEAALQSQADKIKLEDRQRQEKIKELEEDLKILAAGTPAYERKQEEYERTALDRQVWLSYQQQKLNRERAVRIEGIYKKMLDATGHVAKTKGFDLVLFKEPAVKFASITKPEQISALIQVRKVLWAADDLDLTEEVIIYMNNTFTNPTGGNK